MKDKKGTADPQAPTQAIDGSKKDGSGKSSKVNIPSNRKKYKNFLTTKAFSAKKIAKTKYPELQFVVEPFLPVGLSIISGKPKSGKSLLALQVALASAANSNFAGSLKTAKCDSLYFSYEDPPRRLKTRIEAAIGSGSVDDIPDNVIFTHDPFSLDSVIELTTMVKSENPNLRLVVIDTYGMLKSASGNTNGESYAAETKFLAPLHDMAIRFDLAVLLVHHSTKAVANDPFDEVLGSTGIIGVVDTILVVQSKGTRGDVDRILHVTGRDVEAQELAFKFQDQIWTYVGDANIHNIDDKDREIIEAVTALTEPNATKIFRWLKAEKGYGHSLQNLHKRLKIMTTGNKPLLEIQNKKYHVPAPSGENVLLFQAS